MLRADLVGVAVCVACCVHVGGLFLVRARACMLCWCYLVVPCLSRSVLLRFVWLMLVLPTFCPSSPSFSLSLSLSLSLSFFRSLSVSLSLCLSIGDGYIRSTEKHMDSDPRASRCVLVGFCELGFLLAVALILDR